MDTSPSNQVCSASAQQWEISTGDPMETFGTLVCLVTCCVGFVEICVQFVIF